MARWLTYVRERFPVAVYALLVAGFVLSGAYVGAGAGAVAAWPLSFASLGLLAFFFELRLMDEIKDSEKDLVAHPQRPIPRGLIAIAEARRVAVITMGVMTIYGALSCVLVNTISGLLYTAITVYLGLMYKEFFLGTWLQARPILYAATHQIIVLLVVAYAAATFAGDAALSAPVLSLGLVSLGAFFAYEVCRKLDPDAHPILRTYLAIYGRFGATMLVVVALMIAAFGAFRLGVAKVLWPTELLVLAGLALLFVRPKAWKLVEGLATLSLALHLFAGVIAHLAGWRALF